MKQSIKNEQTKIPTITTKPKSILKKSFGDIQYYS